MKTELPSAFDIRMAFITVRNYHANFLAAHEAVKELMGEEFGVVGALEAATLVLSADKRMLALRTVENKHVLYVSEKIEHDGLTLYISPGYTGERQIAYVIKPIFGADELIAERAKQLVSDMADSRSD